MLSPIARAVVMLTLLQGCAGMPVPSHLRPYVSVAQEVFTVASSPPRYGRPSRGQRFVSADPDALAPLRGVWTGSISCRDGAHSLDLFVFSSPRRSLNLAIMGPMTPHGRAMFEVRGSLAGYGGFQFTPGQQLTYPPGVRPVAWSGSVQPDGTFAGSALSGSCGTVRLNRFIGPDDRRYIGAERDNSKFRKELLASEYQMAQLSTPFEQKSWLDQVLIRWGECMALSVCPMPNVLGTGLPPPSMGGGRGGGGYVPPGEEEWIKLGPNDWRTVPTIQARPVHPNYAPELKY